MTRDNGQRACVIISIHQHVPQGTKQDLNNGSDRKS